MGEVKGLLQRLADGETVIVAEGYIFELEARGYLRAGAYVPEVVLEHPEVVKQLHHEFVHAGSDVVLALTYYAHREKLSHIGRDHELEKFNRTALKIARQVADETGTLMAGNLSNSTIFKPDDPEVLKEIYDMATEQVKWAVDEGADFIVAETFHDVGEAMIALRAIKDHGKGLPAVVTYSIPVTGRNWDGQTPGEDCRALEEAGAAVVGLNCGRGPATMMPLLKEVREACKGPVAALPVLYRTNDEYPVFHSLVDVDNPNLSAFPHKLNPYLCSKKQISDFSREAKALGIQYLGLCCGNRAHYLRAMAEAVGRTPPASSLSVHLKSDSRLRLCLVNGAATLTATRSAARPVRLRLRTENILHMRVAANLSTKGGLLQRLADGETVIVAEGYIFELEARGYLRAGAFVPEVVLEHPEVVKQLHQEFVHAGSDVVLALTYYAHREKLSHIGRDHELEKFNRTALKIARQVADETGTLMAGNLCNSTIFKPDDPEVLKDIYDMAAEQVKWAVDEGADFIIAETFHDLGEAMIALRAIKDHGKGLPAVVTHAILGTGKNWDGQTPGEICRALEDAGAAVVGLNCSRGPATMMPLLKEVREACKGPVAALPVLYRTNDEYPTFFSLVDVDNPNVSAFPHKLNPYLCSKKQISDFSREAKALGVQYLGLCCGNRSHYLRAMAEAVGRTPPASRYAPNMNEHFSQSKGKRHEHTQVTLLQCGLKVK